MRAPISVAMIARDESPHVERAFQSVRDHVEQLIVVDTGSSDNTPEIAKKYADVFETWTGCNGPDGRIDDFSAARERSFSHATQPWAMWLDADDTVENPERLAEVVKRYEDQGTFMVILPYDYAHDGAGNVTCTFYRERIVKPRPQFKWLSPVHEVLAPTDPSCPKAVVEDCRVTHWRSRVAKTNQEGGRNLRILQRHYAKTGESDARTLYYIGLEYGYAGDRENSLMFHRRYCQLSGWDDEKALSHIEIVKHLVSKREYDNAIEWALKILTVKEDWGEPYYHLARIYYFKANEGGTRRDWERCVHFGRLYLQTPPTKTILFVNPMERALDIHRYLNHALNFVGDVRGALESCEAGLAADPSDGNLKHNRALYVEFLERQAIEGAIRRMHSVGKATDEQVQIVEAVVRGKFSVRTPGSPALAAQGVGSHAPAPSALPSSGPGLDVAFYVGPGVERWNPESIQKTGCGGSEAMAYEMAKRLARRGHRVRVFGDCAGMEGTFDGVEWLDHTKFVGSSCDVLVASRRPQALDPEVCSSRVRFLWVHDVHCGPEFNYARTLRADRVLCLSQWHRGFMLEKYQHLHPDQVIVTRNGIDLSLYEGEVQRDPHRMFYSSSPDRGLEVAVRCMPRIRERVPDATLHVYYGFDVWEKFAPPEQQQTIAMLRQLMKDHEQHGVVFHGRVPARELAQEQAKCGVWGYPTWFSETSCRTAAEAQLAGCRIVTSAIAALNETVGERGVRLHGDWLSPAYQDQYVDAVVKACTDLELGDRKANREFARTAFDMESLADEWHLMFYRVLKELEVRPLPPYKPAYERAA